MIPQVESVLVHYRENVFSFGKDSVSVSTNESFETVSSISTGFKQKGTDGHGFGHILGFPLMLKESFSCLLNCSV